MVTVLEGVEEEHEDTVLVMVYLDDDDDDDDACVCPDEGWEELSNLDECLSKHAISMFDFSKIQIPPTRETPRLSTHIDGTVPSASKGVCESPCDAVVQDEVDHRNFPYPYHFSIQSILKSYD